MIRSTQYLRKESNYNSAGEVSIKNQTIGIDMRGRCFFPSVLVSVFAGRRRRDLEAPWSLFLRSVRRQVASGEPPA